MTSSSTNSSFRLGLIARADNTGLGIQTKEFYDHMKPTKTLVVDISALTGYANDFSRYPDATIAQGFEVDNAVYKEFLKDLDVVFTVEAAYNHALYTHARQMGVKSVCQYNFEFLGELENRELPRPDLYLAPSPWRMEEVKVLGVPVKYLHVPVNRELFPFKLHTQAKKFLHIAGHTTASDRNGTAILLDALPFIKSDVEITIRTQAALPRPYTDHRLKIIREDTPNYQDLYQGEDVLLLPRRYGGLSLQLNEALSLGMVPIMTDVAPQNEFLDPDLLIMPTRFETIMGKATIDVASCTPEALAEKIDWLASVNIQHYSRQSDKLASERSWHSMKPQYEKVLCDLLSS